MGRWTPTYSPWRHGGWYVNNVRYANGAVGCVSNNYDDGRWRIVCDNRPNAHEQHHYKTRDAAARAERVLAMESLSALHDALQVLEHLTSEDYAKGGDRGVRRTLATYLAAHSYPLDTETRHEYGVDD